MFEIESDCYSRNLSNRHIACNHDKQQTLLLQGKSTSWSNKVRRLCPTNILVCQKAVVMIMFWQFAAGLSYSLFLAPSIYRQEANIVIVTILTAVFAIIFMFSPLAGFLADIKFSRFRVLKCSIYLTLAATTAVLLIVLLMAHTVNTFNNYLFVLIISLGAAVILEGIGHMMFVANILQFGTDQLRDAPSQDTVAFLHWNFWIDHVSVFISSSTTAPGHNFKISFLNKTYEFDNLRSILIALVACVTFIFSMVILCVLHKRQRWFVTEVIRVVNPYKLVYKVIRFACLNKRPIHRSAFTFCEDELPSRIDFGKQKYGGPFSTEHVEDVKVFLRILKVLLCVGPAFFLDVSSTIFIIDYNSGDNTSYNAEEVVKIQMLNNGMLSPILVVVCIPVYLFLVHPFFSRYIPNMLKRMGLAMALQCISFIFLLVLTAVHDLPDSDLLVCDKNSSFIWNNVPRSTSYTYIFIVQHTLSSLYHMLLYIAVWEFICSQSPQSMKGLLFGFLYAIRGLFQWLAVLLVIPFIRKWKPYLSCHSGYLMMNVIIGIVSLLIYTVVARRYKYRKRDDICNVYQYAEDYYSNIQ